MMTANTLQAAIVEAERFLERARRNRDLMLPRDNGVFRHEHFQPRENAATKRAAIDLGHALAKLNAR